MFRILLLIATNFAVMLVLGAVLLLLGPVFGIRSDGLLGLLIVSAVIGFTGSFISLAMSKWLAKRSTGAVVITEPRTRTEAWLLETVRRQAEAAGIGMPEVAIFDSPEMNAFATGMNRNNALVAVSTGLLNNMSADEVEAVLGHEVAHVANGDMVTLTLIQGVVNTFVIFLSRIIGQIVDSAVFKRAPEDGPGPAYFLVSLVMQIVLGFLASIVVFWFSRRREFRADAGGARLAGRAKMIAALERLRAAQTPSHLPQNMQAFGISGGSRGLMRLFMTHPPLEERIEALRRGAA